MPRYISCDHDPHGCLPCRNLRLRAKKEEWRLANLAKVKAASLKNARKRWAADPEGMKRYSRERQRRWRSENLEVQRARDRADYPTRKRRVSFRYGILRNCARRRGIQCLLTKHEYATLTDGARCFYCQGDLPAAGCGLDRKDNAAAYSLANVVPCCGDCNTARGQNFTHEEMKLIGATIRAIRVMRVRQEPAA